MTEDEWLTSGEPFAMAGFACSAVSRKQTLFNVGCCRRVWHLAAEDAHWEAIAAAEQVADGLLAEWEFEDLLQPVVRLWAELPPASRVRWMTVHFLTGAARHLRAADGFASSYAARAVTCAETPDGVDANAVAHEPTEVEAQVRLLRDIFGNPFRPCRFEPAWRTETVTALAAQMYESRDFGAMPILADALQDAGCDNADVLDHCRDPHGVHVRGCWAVDLALGKE